MGAQESQDQEQRRRIRKLEAKIASLEAEKVRLEWVTESIGAGIAVISPDYRVQWINSVIRSIFGDVEGRTCHEVFNHRGEICPDCGVRRILDGERSPVVHEQKGVDLTGRAIWSQIVASPFIDESGGLSGVIEVVIPVTERKRAEEALARSEKRFRNVIESIPLGVHTYRVEEGGRLIFTGANPAADRILGIDNRRFVGLSVEEAFPPLADSEIPGRYRAAALEGEAWRSEHVDYEDEHIKGAFEVHAFQISPGSMAAVFVDITARKRHEADIERRNEELRQLDRLKDALIRDVSHELKTPVAKIAMQLEILEPAAAAHQLSEGQGRALEVMKESLHRQESVIRNLLDLSRLEAGGRRFLREPVKLDEICRSVIDDYGFQAGRLGVRVDLDAEETQVTSDRAMLWHLLSNIVNNAIKFRRPGVPAVVGVAVRVLGEQAIITVRDNGIGMAGNEIERAFDRFYQTTSSADGSGVGLTICKMIADGLGAELTIASDGRNRGTEVTIALPLGGAFPA